MHHPTDRITHTTAFVTPVGGALAGTRNSSMGPPHEGSIRRPIALWANTLPLSYMPLALPPRARLTLYLWATCRSPYPPERDSRSTSERRAARPTPQSATHALSLSDVPLALPPRARLTLYLWATCRSPYPPERDSRSTSELRAARPTPQSATHALSLSDVPLALPPRARLTLYLWATCRSPYPPERDSRSTSERRAARPTPQSATHALPLSYMPLALPPRARLTLYLWATCRSPYPPERDSRSISERRAARPTPQSATHALPLSYMPLALPPRARLTLYLWATCRSPYPPESDSRSTSERRAARPTPQSATHALPLSYVPLALPPRARLTLYLWATCRSPYPPERDSRSISERRAARPTPQSATHALPLSYMPLALPPRARLTLYLWATCHSPYPPERDSRSISERRAARPTPQSATHALPLSYMPLALPPRARLTLYLWATCRSPYPPERDSRSTSELHAARPTPQSATHALPLSDVPLALPPRARLTLYLWATCRSPYPPERDSRSTSELHAARPTPQSATHALPLSYVPLALPPRERLTLYLWATCRSPYPPERDSRSISERRAARPTPQSATHALPLSDVPLARPLRARLTLYLWATCRSPDPPRARLTLYLWATCRSPDPPERDSRSTSDLRAARPTPQRATHALPLSDVPLALPPRARLTLYLWATCRSPYPPERDSRSTSERRAARPTPQSATHALPLSYVPLARPPRARLTLYLWATCRSPDPPERDSRSTSELRAARPTPQSATHALPLSYVPLARPPRARLTLYLWATCRSPDPPERDSCSTSELRAARPTPQSATHALPLSYVPLAWPPRARLTLYLWATCRSPDPPERDSRSTSELRAARPTPQSATHALPLSYVLLALPPRARLTLYLWATCRSPDPPERNSRSTSELRAARPTPQSATHALPLSYVPLALPPRERLTLYLWATCRSPYPPERDSRSISERRAARPTPQSATHALPLSDVPLARPLRARLTLYLWATCRSPDPPRARLTLYLWATCRSPDPPERDSRSTSELRAARPTPQSATHALPLTYVPLALPPRERLTLYLWATCRSPYPPERDSRSISERRAARPTPQSATHALPLSYVPLARPPRARLTLYLWATCRSPYPPERDSRSISERRAARPTPQSATHALPLSDVPLARPLRARLTLYLWATCRSPDPPRARLTLYLWATCRSPDPPERDSRSTSELRAARPTPQSATHALPLSYVPLARPPRARLTLYLWATCRSPYPPERDSRSTSELRAARPTPQSATHALPLSYMPLARPPRARLTLYLWATCRSPYPPERDSRSTSELRAARLTPQSATHALPLSYVPLARPPRARLTLYLWATCRSPDPPERDSRSTSELRAARPTPQSATHALPLSYVPLARPPRAQLTLYLWATCRSPDPPERDSRSTSELRAARPTPQSATHALPLSYVPLARPPRARRAARPTPQSATCRLPYPTERDVPLALPPRARHAACPTPQSATCHSPYPTERDSPRRSFRADRRGAGASPRSGRAGWPGSRAAAGREPAPTGPATQRSAAQSYLV